MEPTGAAWVTPRHRPVINQPYVGEVGGFLASEVLGAFESPFSSPMTSSPVWISPIRSGPIKYPSLK